MAYIGWFIFMIVLILNNICAWITIFSCASCGITTTITKIQFVIISAAFIPICIPIHFVICYWSLYSCLRTLHIVRFIIFFIVYAFALLFCLFGFTGYYEYGACGLYLVVLYASSSLVAMIANLLMTILWAVMFIYFLLIYIQMIIIFRREYKTMKSASDATKKSVMKGVSETVATGIQTVLTNQKQ